MTYIFFDNPSDKEKMTFITNNDSLPIESVFPKEKVIGFKKTYDFCNQILKKTNQDDTLFFWYDFIGVLFSLICKFHHQKRKIVILNILLKDKKTLKNKVARKLYRSSLSSENVIYTVTSAEYGDHLRKSLRIKKNYFLLHDPYCFSNNCSSTPDNGYLFCGGRNGRDWNFIIKIAKELPQYSFHFVMSDSDYENFKDGLPKNVRLKHDIPMNEFLDELQGCSFVTMPLDTEAPAGLLAFFQAADNNKMIMTSDTLTSREYFSNQRGVLCSYDTEDWKNKICFYKENSQYIHNIVNNCRKFLIENCSQDCYLKGLSELKSKIEEEKN